MLNYITRNKCENTYDRGLNMMVIGLLLTWSRLKAGARI
jgi:hypothetical protein